MNWFQEKCQLGHSILIILFVKMMKLSKIFFFKELICAKEIKESWESKIFYFDIDFSKLIRKTCVEDVAIK